MALITSGCVPLQGPGQQLVHQGRQEGRDDRLGLDDRHGRRTVREPHKTWTLTHSMALITSDCDAMRSQTHNMGLRLSVTTSNESTVSQPY